MKNSRIAFLGTGNMATAILEGLTRVERPPTLVASFRRQARCDELGKRFPQVTCTLDNVAAARAADIVVICVKPQLVDRLLTQIAPAIDRDKLVISVAAGVPLAAMERKLCEGARLVRAMPNTPSLVGAGACAIAAGAHASAEDLQTAQSIFEAVGTCVVVDDERLLDAVTGLSGSGPAYVFLIIEALTDAGVKVGLPRYVALQLASQTVLGSARLLLETGMHPGQLKDQVTSPGGTAIAGLHTLEAGGLRTTLINAVETATHRARELGTRWGTEQADEPSGPTRSS